MSTTLSNLNINSQILADVANGLLSGNFNNRSAATPSVGTAAGSINLLVHQTFTVSSGTPLSIDLTSVVDVAGNTVSFGHLCYSKVVNSGTNSGGDLNFGGGTNGVFTLDPKVVRANGGIATHYDPNPGITVDSTHKIVTVASVSGTVTGSITLAGRSV
jgi:hypothetical protein